MDYLKPVLIALDYIEQHLTETLTPEKVAKKAAFSRFHFHRIFMAVTGNTMAGYIRRRRLTQAASELATTKKKIIDIALDYQFETPESFLRAFKNMFGATPSTYRKAQDSFKALHQPVINEHMLMRLKKGGDMKAKIITKDTFKVIGLRYYGENQNREITKLWDSFLPIMNRIKNRIHPSTSYGVCYPEEDPTKKDFEYIAAVEVSDINDIPEGMAERTIPRQTYAVFTHKGALDNLTETYQAIYAVWQPKSGYELIKAPDFEFYDERFKPNDPDHSEVDLYIPVKAVNSAINTVNGER